jgi:hypothetical protein
VAFSGGKDSVAAVLDLKERGVAMERVELWHHEVDGREGSWLRVRNLHKPPGLSARLR